MQTRADLQHEVNEYFESSSEYWKNIYRKDELLPRIYQERHDTTLAWIQKLGLTSDARILEVGCGAGLTSIALAKGGYTVDAMDSTMAMLHTTSRNARSQCVENRVRMHFGDVHKLHFEAQTFDLVIAIGVLPWLHSERMAIQEMQRVLKDGGYLLATADNDARLIRMLDPASCPAFAPLRRIAKGALQLLGRWSPRSGFQATRHDRHEIRRLLNQCGLQELQSCTIGFGPFTCFGKGLFADSTGIELHRRLQKLSSRQGWSPLRWTGSHYLVLAEKI